MEKKRNLWVIPTDKPSRIFKLAGDLHLHEECGIDPKRNQNIYITSDEEIKKENWCYHPLLKGGSVIQSKFNNPNSTMKKIILTTDPDLVKDGVQSIPDEFLEWFINNQSCEYVKVISNSNYEMLYKVGASQHKIIIPKEESKQEFLKQKRMSGAKTVSRILEESELKCDFCKRYPRLEGTNKCESCYSVVRHVLEQDPRFKETLLPDLRKKQESLEGAAKTELYITINKIIDGGKDLPKGHNVTRGQAVDYAFETALKIAKWQAERMYSEEEVKEILFHRETHYMKTAHHLHINEWFEQFKKK